MKNYFKVIWRSFAKNAAKLISLTVIMALGIAFVAGLGTLSPTILDSIDAELEASSAPDFIIKSHSALGFTEEQRDGIASLSFVTATDTVNTQPLEKIVYFSAEYFPLTMLVTDVYASADALRGLDRFSDEYEERAEEYALKFSA